MVGKTLTLWCYCVVFWLGSGICGADEMRFERLFSDNNFFGQNVGAVNAVEQDARGFIWIGGENGLARYDGVNFKRYASDLLNPKAIPNNYVWDLQLDQDGVLWVATDVGLVRYNATTDDFTRFLHKPNDANSLPGNFVRAIGCDEDNNLYIATTMGLVQLDTERKHFTPLYTSATHGPSASKFEPYMLQTLYLDKQQNLWLGAVYSGLYRLHLPTKTLTHFKHDRADPGSLSHEHVRAINQDQHGRYWVVTYGGGINRLNPDGVTFTHYRAHDVPHKGVTTDVFMHVFLDSRQNLWFASDQGGLLRYDEKTDRFTSIKHNDYDTTSLSSNQLRVVFEDHEGDLWIGAFPSGVNYYNQATDLFTNFYHKPDQPNSLSHNAILSLLEDSQGIIWIGSEAGLTTYNRKTGEFVRYLKNMSDPNALHADAILSLMEDRDHNVWIGTWGAGLYKFDRQRKQLQQFKPEANNPNSLTSLYVWSIIQDREGIIWLATEKGGLNRLDPATNLFSHYVNNPNDANSLSENIVWSVIEDKNGDLWLGTTGSLDRFNKKNQTFYHYQKLNDEPAADNAIRIRVVREDSVGRIWVGTQDNGVFIYNPATRKFSQLNEAKGLPSNQVVSVLEDNDHYIWLSTSNGLARLDGQDLSLRVFQHGHGLPGNNFNRDASLKSRDGLLYFGSTAGLSAFDPRNLHKGKNNFPVAITEFRVFNEVMSPHKNPEVLTADITQTKTIHLQHHQNMLSFAFAALNYRDARYNQYAYKLEGFDENWNQAGPNQRATYTNLNPGNYVFHVKAANRDGEWSPADASVNIYLQPPPWRTLWAFGAYGFLLLMVGFITLKSVFRHLEFKAEKALNAELRNLNSIKDTFLANTSHELRTPLNGMIGMAQTLLDEAPGLLPAKYIQYLNLIVFSGRRLSALINDILDYSKLKEHKLQLFYSSIDLYQAVETAFMLLTPLADTKGIHLVNTIDRHLEPLWADENRLQQILLNLIGNGIKYTDKGSVTLSAWRDQEQLMLMVEDTGIGIEASQIDQLFQAFSQLGNGDKRLQGGTGLGLSVCKQLVELHGGELTLTSSLGKGSKFCASFPVPRPSLLAKEDDAFTPGASPAETQLDTQIIAPKRDSHVVSLDREKTNGALTPVMIRRTSRKTAASPLDPGVYRLLIVDDDPVNRLVLDSLLRQQGYQLAQAASGREALDYVAKNPVDLIILDVMMPGMTGYEVCSELRLNYPIEDLPIIFLTANKVDDEVMKGFSAGGNEFLTKPISKADLLPRVANHLNLLRLYRQLKVEGR